jgi:hypothetical protein
MPFVSHFFSKTSLATSIAESNRALTARRFTVITLMCFINKRSGGRTLFSL